MKKISFLVSALILFTLIEILFYSCKKKNSEVCEIANTNGRIIGYNPCKHFVDWGKIRGAGFVIEIDKGLIKDTTVSYEIPENLFVFLPSYIDGSYSSYLFKPEVQDKFKIKFKYRDADESEKTLVLCNGMVNIAHYDFAVKGKEMFISCISRR